MIYQKIITWLYENTIEQNRIKQLEAENKTLQEALSDCEITLQNNSQPIETPKVLGLIKINILANLLSAHCPRENIFLSDPYYDTTSMEEAKKYTAKSKISQREYKSEGYDCDNFSFSLHGYWSDALKSFSWGSAWSQSHAFNIMVDNNGAIWIVEPQTNGWYPLDSLRNNPQYYPFRMVLI